VYVDDLAKSCDSLRGVYLVLYADDILLVSSTVTELQNMLRNCERELRTVLDISYPNLFVSRRFIPKASLALTLTLSGVARICCEEGQTWKLGHGALTVDFMAGCSSCSMTDSFVTNAVLIERAASC